MTDRRAPYTLLLAAAVALLEAVALLVWGVLSLVKVGTAASVGGAIAGGVFFVLCAVAVGFGAYALWRLHSWARAPMVLVQLIVLGVAWSSRHEIGVAIVLAIVAVAGLVGILAPQSIQALDSSDG
ncbi:MAG: hypothetical protein J2O46_03485 [Nocardioides sp.]|nr:hypothetical protein [Nocardioides sp.]